MSDRLGALFQERTVRRAVSLALFIGLLVLFRHLLVLLVFFVSFERLIGVPSEWLAKRIPRRAAVGIVALLMLGALGPLAGVEVGRAVRAVPALRATLPDRIAALRDTPLFQKLQEHLPDADTLIENAKHYASSAVGFLSALGHVLLYALIGFIL